MIRVIRADIGRILMKKRLYIFFILGMLVTAIAMLFGSTGLEQIDYAKKALTYVSIPLNCLLVYLAVFAEEFHTGTMQCVIGRGYSRRVIVHAKFFDCVIMLAWYFMWTYLAFVAANRLDNIGSDGGTLLGKTLLLQLLLYTVISAVKAVVCMAVTMVFLFLTWNIPIGMLVMLFVAFLSDVITKAFQGNLDIPVYDFSANGLLETAYSRIVMGGVGWQMAVVLLIYTGVPIALTCLIFQTKEVDL